MEERVTSDGNCTAHQHGDGGRRFRILWGRVPLVLGGLSVAAWLTHAGCEIHSRRTWASPQSKALAGEILKALGAYQQKHGRWPAAFVSDETAVLTTGDIAMELASGTREEPAFLPDLKVHDAESPGPGLSVRSDGSMEITDAWGRPYRVRVDVDGDGKVPNPHPGGNPADVATKVLVWSGGKDGDPETWEDNVTSWMRK